MMLRIFKPAWQRSERKAREAVETYNAPKNLMGIVLGCPYPAVRIEAIQKLRKSRELGSDNALLSIARQSESALDRCEAANALRSRYQVGDEAESIIARSAVDACREIPEDMPYVLAPWLLRMDEELVAACLEATQGKPRVQQWIRESTIDWDSPEMQMRVILESDDPTVVRGTRDRFRGHHSQYVRIAEEATDEETVRWAIEALDDHDTALLERLVDEGYEEAKRRLVKVAPERYGDRYPHMLAYNDLTRAVDGHWLSEASLEGIILRCAVLDDRGIGWRALQQIDDPQVLAHLLCARSCPQNSYSGNMSAKAWFVGLVEKLFDQQEVLADFLLLPDSQKGWKYMDDTVLDYIVDPHELKRIALADHPCAERAAKTLSIEDMGQLAQEGRRSAVRDYAQAQVYAYALRHGTLDDAGLLEVVRWSWRHADLELACKAADAIEAQEVCVEALVLFEHLSNDAEDVEACAGRLLGKVGKTGGRILVDKCLGGSFPFRREALMRLRKLFSGTQTEERILAELHSRLNEGSPVDHGAQEALDMSVAYLGSSRGAAAWRIGGREYVQALIGEVQRREGELEDTKIAARLLTQIYSEHMGSADSAIGSISRVHGAHYPKHVDFAAYCASESCNRLVDYVAVILPEEA